MEKKTNFNYYFKGKVRVYFSRFQEKSSILLKVVWPNACFLAKSRDCISKSVHSNCVFDVTVDDAGDDFYVDWELRQ